MDAKERLELAVLAAAYQTPDGVKALQRVPLRYFTNPIHRRIAERLLEGLPLGGEALMLRDVALSQGLPPLEQAINDLLLEGYLREVEQHAAKIHKACLSRDLSQVNDLITSFPTEPFHTGEEYTISMLLEELEEPSYTIPLPPELLGLQNLWGPLYPGGVYVVAAPEGAGKSALAEQTALHAARQGIAVVDFTLELAAQVRVLRYLQHLGGAAVGPQAYFQGRLDREKLAQYREELHNLPLHIVSGTDDVHAMLAAAERFEDARLFVVDFVQSLGVGDVDQYTLITNAMKQIFRYARDTNTIWLVLSQMNREGLRRVLYNDSGQPVPPDNTALEGSSKIAQYAWTVTFILPRSQASRDVWVTKNRIGGITGHVQATYVGEYLTFHI
ncbi:replicative DNA helicase [Thermus phage phiFa]|nr:replicative DNA helicase [Thermus phage phiFa]